MVDWADSAPAIHAGLTDHGGSNLAKHKKYQTKCLTFFMVGVGGFEPPTSPSRTVRATELRHTPINY